MTPDIPEKSYGVLLRSQSGSACEDAAEQLMTLGYAVLDAGHSSSDIHKISLEFERIRDKYRTVQGERRLQRISEHNTVRAPLIQGGTVFLELALNRNLLILLQHAILGKFILNQQNGVINPPRQTYNQAAWHRDFPYQHFVSSRPLGITALYCVDDFSIKNGATHLLPASHVSEAFPTARYIERNAIQVEAKAGSFILMNCMLFHAGGFNNTELERRAVNHVYTIPYFKQQINLPKNLEEKDLSSEAREILGFDYGEPSSIDEYLNSMDEKINEY